MAMKGRAKEEGGEASSGLATAHRRSARPPPLSPFSARLQARFAHELGVGIAAAAAAAAALDFDVYNASSNDIHTTITTAAAIPPPPSDRLYHRRHLTGPVEGDTAPLLRTGHNDDDVTVDSAALAASPGWGHTSADFAAAAGKHLDGQYPPQNQPPQSAGASPSCPPTQFEPGQAHEQEQHDHQRSHRPGHTLQHSCISNDSLEIWTTPRNHRSADATPTPTTAPTRRPLNLGDGSLGRKRAASSADADLDVDFDDSAAATAAAGPSNKRLRLRPRSKHYLDSFLVPSAFNSPIDQPPSPLFFSHSPRSRPDLLPRFSSSEAGAKMLSKTRGEDSQVRTVSLARGLVATPQPLSASVSPWPNGRPPERSHHAKSVSPESILPGNDAAAAATKDAGLLLSSIGVLELLEQDERPAFVVDLGDNSNFGPGQLYPFFMNSALRGYEGLEAVVCGYSAAESPSFNGSLAKHLQFKSWLLNAAISGQSLDVCLPSFIYAGMSWSCSTLRKRLRVISGTVILPQIVQKMQDRSTPAPFALPLTTITEQPNPLIAPTSGTASVEVASDYFGTAVAGIARSQERSAVSSTISEAVPTTEHLQPIDVLSAATRPARTSSPRVASNGSEVNIGDIMDTASPTANDRSVSTPMSLDASFTHLPASVPESPSFDWTRLPVNDSMPQHIQFALSVDWAATPLGPIEHWSSDLRQMCNLIMASPHPAAMYWGEDDVAIYNEAYIPLAGQKHPTLMGQPYRLAWSEIWDEVKDAFSNAKTTGQATMKDDDCLFLKRHSFLEECYFSWSIIPLVGSDGSVMGLYNPAFEKTRRKIAERRMLTLRELGERTSSARDVKSFWAQVLVSFEFNEYDSPFLLLYSASEENDSDGSSIHSNSVVASRQCSLEGSLGIPPGHPSAPAQIDLKSGNEGFGPVFREVSKTDRPVLLDVGSKDLPHSLLQGLASRGFGDEMQHIVVCPIHPTTGESSLGFLVLGVNPRRPYDDDYSLFVQLLTRQLATSLASIMLFEEEIRRGQKAAKLAALDRIELSEQLAARTQEAIESETKFTRMAEFAPVGMFIAGPDGRINFANDSWYEISRVPRNNDMAETWMDAVNLDDHELVKKLWEDLTVHKKPVSSELRFKAQYTDRGGNKGETWVLLSGYPEKDREGRLKSVFGSLTNISQQKWAENIQTRKMEEAVELKRQQENFIDITSHEMRNPLSAILQCADEISSCLTSFRDSRDDSIMEDVIDSCLDAAQIISLCSQHQKRIVDDVLTLSKLDSQLLLVTPVDVQPLTLVQRALKMHEAEMEAADIQLKFLVDQAYRDLELDWVRLDPSRVMQVLINLTTNAIKFTGSESKRTITVTIGASRERPSQLADSPVNYFPTRSKRHDILMDKDWGDGEKVFVMFSVQDTGRGLDPEEKKLLFMRFSQASPRTHVQYGGSGLGLFISRELTELQGGEIGVESEFGRGSIFSFYVAARRTCPPKDTDSIVGVKRSAAQGGIIDGAKAKKLTGGALKRTTSRVLDSNCDSSILPAPAVQLPANNKKPLRKRVLIVEDNLVNQRVLQKQLKNLGTEVHLANHGGEALEKLRQSTFWAGKEANGDNNGNGITDSNENAQATRAAMKERIEIGVVLMDQEMPVMDGLTCTRRIRELEREGYLTGHVPIIAVTANARREQVQTALDAGMDDVVSKPFRIPELIPKIEELMEKHPAPPALSTANGSHAFAD